MGAWLKKYGPSIYATRGGPFKPGTWGASTRAGKYIYLHVFNWPGEELVLPPMGTKIVSSKALTGGQVVVKQTAAGITIAVPEKDRRDIDTIVRLRLAGPAGDIAPVAMTPTVQATASNVYQNDEDYGADKAFDGDPNTRWATDGGTRQAWVAVDLGKPVRFDGVRIREAYEGRVKKFEFQGKENGEWKTIFAGEGIGKEFSRQFPLVTAREVRLNILEASEGPTIYEIQLARRE
jgi:alpha-L-fucosidase